MSSHIKPLFTYSLHQLPRREAALFDSFVRIINTRTLHHWQLLSDAAAGPADLPVYYDSEDGRHLLDASRLHLVVGRQPRKIVSGNGLYLAVPLRSDRLEKCLDHLGLRLQGQASTAPGLDSQFPMTGRMLQLRRWPPHELLASNAQLRLATILTGAPTTLETLSSLSGLSWQECSAFIDLLERHGLLGDSAPPPSPTTRPPPPKTAWKTNGLLIRIRRSLGLESGRTYDGI